MLPDKIDEELYQARSRRIEVNRTALISKYRGLWKEMIQSWRSSARDDFAWLMYSANYLLRTDNVRWAIDPITLQNRVPQAPLVNVKSDLQDLSFVLLTHHHMDHLDLSLLFDLRDHQIQWIIPKEMLSIVREHSGIDGNHIIVPVPNETITMDRMRITPFNGLHWDTETKYDSLENINCIRGVPSIGYLIETGQKRWLFPGDTRTYDIRLLQRFKPVDTIFAHLWLGRGAALMNEPPLLKAFCKFFLAVNPHRIVLTHLEEYGRSIEDFWTCDHADQVMKYLYKIAPGVDVVTPRLGEPIAI